MSFRLLLKGGLERGCYPHRSLVLGLVLWSAAHSGCSNADDSAVTSVRPSPELRDKNPDGIAYPRRRIGTGARTSVRAGNVIPNLHFLGYPGATGPASDDRKLVTIALSDYYDPEGKRQKLIHLTVVAPWCDACNSETSALVARYPDLSSRGVVVLQGLADGFSPSEPATQLDLDVWIHRHRTTFPQFLDPDLRLLSIFFDKVVVPWNAYVDPRSMEILYANTGMVEGRTTEAYLAWVLNNPATASDESSPQ